MERIYRTSAETQNRAVQFIEESVRRNKEGLGFGLDIKNQLNIFGDLPITPVTNGLVTILGYTGMFKTSFAKIILNKMVESFKDPNDLAVYVNYEESLEELALKDVTRISYVKQSSVIRGEVTPTEIASLKRISAEQSVKPVWVVADSIYDEGYKEQPNIKDILHQLIKIRDEEKKNIRLVVIDYFQIMPLMIKNPAREGHSRNAVYLQRMGNMLGCPILLLSQTNRNPQERGIKLPKLSDAAETSSLEKSSRAVYGVYLPWKDHEELGGKIKINGITYDITPDLFVVRLLKQKHNPYPLTKVLYIDFDDLDLMEKSKFT